MLHGKSFEQSPALATPERAVVLLVIDDPTLCARYAYGLSATGFDVAMPDGLRGNRSAPRPDIVLIAFPEDRHEIEQVTQALARDLETGDIPMVAIARDAGTASLARARIAGCTAVCLTTCPADVLASGLHAVLERAGRDSQRAR